MSDWTTDETGKSNSSVEFVQLAGVVARLIRGDAYALLAGHADSTAGLILAQLAHVYGFGPLAAAEQRGYDRAQLASVMAAEVAINDARSEQRAADVALLRDEDLWRSRRGAAAWPSSDMPLWFADYLESLPLVTTPEVGK